MCVLQLFPPTPHPPPPYSHLHLSWVGNTQVIYFAKPVVNTGLFPCHQRQMYVGQPGIFVCLFPFVGDKGSLNYTVNKILSWSPSWAESPGGVSEGPTEFFTGPTGTVRRLEKKKAVGEKRQALCHLIYLADAGFLLPFFLGMPCHGFALERVVHYALFFLNLCPLSRNNTEIFS